MKELPCVAVFVDDFFAANSDVPNVIVAVEGELKRESN